MPDLKAVLFDLDDTLFSTTAFAKRARLNAVQAMRAAGLDFPEEVVLRELGEVINEFSSNYSGHYDNLLHRLCPQGLGGINPAIVVASGVVAYHNTKFLGLEPFEDVRGHLKWLRQEGLCAGVVTHGWTTKQAEKLVRLGLMEFLDPKAIFISDQIGIAKPNPKLYSHVLRELGLKPSEVIYVGDNPQHDILPPQSLGICAVWASRGAKHSLEGIVPDYEIKNFGELEEILRRDFGIGAG